MKKLFISLFLFPFFNILFVFTQDDFNKIQINDLKENITIKIDLANPKIYYQNDEIYVNIKIFNKSDNDVYCTIADNKKYSFDFQLVTIQNRQIEHSIDFISSFHRIQSIFTRHIKINPGEGYIFKAKLNDYYDLEKPGQYFIKCFFYPGLKLNNSYDNTISSNQLSLNIRPAKITEETIIEQESVEKEKKMYVTKRSPDEVIEFMLDARMKKEWEKYFLYIELNELIKTNNDFYQDFLKSDVERKREIIENYKTYLKRDTIDEISFMPVRYEIVKTEYTKGEAKVYVIEYFKYMDYIEKKFYTYFLNKFGNIWYVTSYEVMNFK